MLSQRRRRLQQVIVSPSFSFGPQRQFSVLLPLLLFPLSNSRVTQQTMEYCFRKAGYGRGQLSGVSDVVMRNEDDDAFQHESLKFSGMDNQKFDDYVSVNSHLATSGVNPVEELCESHVGATMLDWAEEEGEDTEPEVVPNFAEALVKVKSFVYAHSKSDGDRDSV
jgi:hypothetical protein